MSYFSEIDIDAQSNGFPADTLAVVAPIQMDPQYLRALHLLAQVEGAGRFAAVTQFIGDFFGKAPGVVLGDCCTEVPA